MEYQWNIFIADLNPVKGSEQGKRRPILVISNENINQILPIVNILPITSHKQGRKVYPNEVLLKTDISGLNQDSLVLAYQIRTLDKTRLEKQIGSIQSTDIQSHIKESLRFQLEL